MTSVKTAISIDEVWFQKAEKMATEMKISRSSLFLLAIQQLFEEYESRKMIEKLNEIYDNYTPLPEDLMFAQKMQEQQKKAVEGTW